VRSCILRTSLCDPGLLAAPQALARPVDRVTADGQTGHYCEVRFIRANKLLIFIRANRYEKQLQHDKADLDSGV
jgi:hypothetical protein